MLDLWEVMAFSMTINLQRRHGHDDRLGEITKEEKSREGRS